MRNIRAAIVPVLLLAVVYALAWVQLTIDQIAQFDFIWDVLLGIVLGLGLAFLPGMAGFAQRRNSVTTMFWICGFLSLLVIFYQYISLVTGMRINEIAFLTAPGPRLRIVEGALLGYCSCVAGRGKI